MKDTAALVRRMQAGDEAAFDEIYAAYLKGAVRTAALISGDNALAEDIAQESFVLCLVNIGKLKNPDRFRPWFYRILTRCAWRAGKGRPQENWSESVENSLPAADVYPSDFAHVYTALDQLNAKQRTTVILRYFSGLSLREIAETTHVPESTVKTRLYAAKRKLARILKEEAQ